ncbi:MAG: prepilin peptidase [Lachnospiraceae bacterium]|nr:prepilin peptidase [Lachnospiraceae bacterium]
MFPVIALYTVIFLYGIVIGSFLNVVIYRAPKKENMVTTRSHCMSCGYQLAWFDLIPLFSWLALGGKCRKCKARISVQYPLVEGLNGLLYLAVFARYELSIESLLYCLLFSALLALSVIDFRTFEIPEGFNFFILTLGLVRVLADRGNWLEYVIGLISVSAFLAILYYASHGAAIGGGDVKLMAATGLLLGWKKNLFAFVLGCILGSVIHLIRMKISKEGHQLAMGPYLAAGVAIAALWGDELVNWYLHMIGF